MNEVLPTLTVHGQALTPTLSGPGEFDHVTMTLEQLLALVRALKGRVFYAR